jgi:predicted HNH restriction endonuclease
MEKLPPSKLIEEPLLKAIIKRGGSVIFSKDGRDLEIDLARHFNLSDAVRDFATPNCPAKGGRKWRYRIQWVKQQLVLKGEIDNTVDNIWPVTEAGYKRVGIQKTNVILESSSRVPTGEDKLSEATLNEKIFPDEIDSTETFREGSVRRTLINTYERDSDARRKCIEHYGSTCSVCSFSFGKVFGKIGEGFIHVHHLRPISEIAEEYQVDPVKDLRPVCPNCHAMLHRRSPCFSIEEVKNLIELDHDSSL